MKISSTNIFFSKLTLILSQIGIAITTWISIFSIMSNEETTPSKSKNPEDYVVFDKQALAKYTTDTGKILPRKYTGLTPMQQRKISKLIKKARHLQLLS